MQNVHRIFGAPGCGKTTRLMDILMQELKTNDPNKIAYVSFTRKGTYEGVERAKALYKLDDGDLPFFRTLHSIAFRVGGFCKHDMISKNDYRIFSEAMGMKFSGYYTEELYSNDDKYLFMYFMKRNNPTTAALYDGAIDGRIMRDVEYNYIKFKEFEKIHDYTDLIERFIDCGEALPVDIAIIDEAQDLTSLQWRMCEVAFANCKRIYIAGDDDQAIYEWAGADVNYFLKIKAQKDEILHQSYRLQKTILQKAKAISSMISHRVDKQFEALSDKGNVYLHNDLSTIELNNDESWYFLSRNNCYLSEYTSYLRQKACVFTSRDGLSYDKKHIDAINIFEQARRVGKLSETDELKLSLYLNRKVDLLYPWYLNLNFPNDKTAYYKDLIKYKTPLSTRNMVVSTIHGVKGGEADNVVVLLNITRAVKTNMDYNPDSELRCLYVAVTRAKKNLHIVFSTSTNGYDSYLRGII